MATLAPPQAEPSPMLSPGVTTVPDPVSEPGRGPVEALIREARRRRRRRWMAGTLCALVAGAAGAWVALRGTSPVGASGRTTSQSAGAPGVAALASSNPCASSVSYGPLPTWARAGFHPEDTSMPYVLGARGEIVAILWARHEPLKAPPLPNRNNKILWVSRAPLVGASNLQISARRWQGTRPVGAIQHRVVVGGPGPSGIDMPVRGCWQFSLTWSGHHDTVYLPYNGS